MVRGNPAAPPAALSAILLLMLSVRGGVRGASRDKTETCVAAYFLQVRRQP